MANEKNKVKKSLHKFLSDNLDVFVTYDSNESELKPLIENAMVSSDVVAGTTSFQLYQGGTLLTGINSVDIIGESLYNETSFENAEIVDWDDVTSTITILSGFSNDLTEFDSLSVSPNSLIYLTKAYDIDSDNGSRCFSDEIESYELIIKVKDDSNKDKVDDILQEVTSLFKKNYQNFPVYDDNLIDVLTHARIYSFRNSGKIDVNNDIQSYLSSFLVAYSINYNN